MSDSLSFGAVGLVLAMAPFLKRWLYYSSCFAENLAIVFPTSTSGALGA
jgi:hypothetical protein